MEIPPFRIRWVQASLELIGTGADAQKHPLRRQKWSNSLFQFVANYSPPGAWVTGPCWQSPTPSCHHSSSGSSHLPSFYSNALPWDRFYLLLGIFPHVVTILAPNWWPLVAIILSNLQRWTYIDVSTYINPDIFYFIIFTLNNLIYLSIIPTKFLNWRWKHHTGDMTLWLRA